jgi:hypothetical protein
MFFQWKAKVIHDETLASSIKQNTWKKREKKNK